MNDQRTALKTLGTKDRHTFTAIVERFGTKSFKGHEKRTILLKDVRRDDGEPITDHLWFEAGKSFADLIAGDAIQFDARATAYRKGYVNMREGIDERRIDYRLSRPTKVVKMEPAAA